MIFNALIIVALGAARAARRAVPNHRARPDAAAQLVVYGIGGLVAPFPCIWAIDRILGWLHLA